MHPRLHTRCHGNTRSSTFIWSIILYECESWTPKKYKKIQEAVKMWIWRRVTKTIWIQWKSNLKMFDEVSESRKCIKVVEKRRVKCIGHLLWHNGHSTTCWLYWQKGTWKERKRKSKEALSWGYQSSHADW